MLCSKVHECYVASLKLTLTVNCDQGRIKLHQKLVVMTDLDPWVYDEIRVEPKDNDEEW